MSSHLVLKSQPYSSSTSVSNFLIGVIEVPIPLQPISGRIDGKDLIEVDIYDLETYAHPSLLCGIVLQYFLLTLTSFISVGAVLALWEGIDDVLHFAP